MEVLTTAAAMAIGKIALNKFVNGGAGVMGKPMTMGAEKRLTELADLVWEMIRGDSGAVEILKGAAQEKPDDVQALHHYLSSLWIQHPEFAENVRGLANTLNFELTQIQDNSPMTSQLASEDSETSTSLSKLASLYKSEGQYDKAELLYKRALAIAELQLGPDHPSTGTRLNNLGSLYNLMGRYSEAEPLLQRALMIAEKQLGPDHPQTGGRLNNLGLLYVSMGRYSEAEPLYQRSLTIVEKQLGPDHPDTGIRLSGLAWLYQSMGRYSEAELLYQRALDRKSVV